MRRLLVLALAVAPIVAEAQAVWTVDPKPTFDLRGVNDAGAVVFGDATWATRLRNGTTVLADASTPALHFIDAAGKVIKSAGRSGSGPGDFRTVTWVSVCGGAGLLSWDFPQTRISSWDESGAFKESFPFGPRGGASTITACNGSGTLVAHANGRVLPPRTPPDPSATYTIREIAGTTVLVSLKGDTLAKLPERSVMEVIGGRGGGGPRPLGLDVPFALGDDRLWLGITDSSLIAVHSLDGKRVGTITVNEPPRPLTPEHYERALDRYLGIVPPSVRQRFRESMKSVPPPGRLPPFTALFADRSGLVWAVLSSPGDSNTRLRAFGPDGRVVANTTIPVNISVFEVGVDYVLGSRFDSDGEPHFLAFKLSRGGRP